jgi:hypothetical protein
VLIAADEPAVNAAADDLGGKGVIVEAVQTDLSTRPSTSFTRSARRCEHAIRAGS